MASASTDSLFRLGIAKPNYSKGPKIYSNKDDILNSTIKQIYVVIKKNERNKIPKSLIKSAKKFPARFSMSNYNHALIIARAEYNNKISIILIEYGGYDYKLEGDYESMIHYYYENEYGLRFIKLSDNELASINNGKHQIIRCDIRNEMTIEKLLFDSQFVGKFHKWNYKNYFLTDQNCQLFVRKVVDVLGATRKFDHQKTRDYSRMYIPHRILKGFVDNEKGKNQMKIQNKILNSKRKYVYDHHLFLLSKPSVDKPWSFNYYVWTKLKSELGLCDISEFITRLISDGLNNFSK